MAAAPQSAPAPAPAPATSKTKVKKRPSARPDVATLGGIALAVAGIVGGLVLEKGSIQDIAQGTAAMIVLGGTFGAVLVTNPLDVVLRAFAGLRNVFFEAAAPATDTIEALIQFATKSRKHGIVSLETDAAAITDPFFKKALNLAVDGTDLQEIRKMMEIDIALGEQASEAEAKVWEAAGGYSPTIGIIGAVLGLIQVMKHLEDIKEVGHGIAVAFVATVYGVASANIFFLPVANKLRARTRQAIILKDLTLEGVIGIVEGLNPTLIRMKLETFSPAPVKKKSPKAAKKAAGPEPAAGAKK
ncbi:MAG TPA: flagellar motor protein [Candidatus Limnocylindrales bacterium]|nr:flagellar motor protein [Candidatus Limnocylindrales bacterium]